MSAPAVLSGSPASVQQPSPAAAVPATAAVPPVLPTAASSAAMSPYPGAPLLSTQTFPSSGGTVPTYSTATTAMVRSEIHFTLSRLSKFALFIIFFCIIQHTMCILLFQSGVNSQIAGLTIGNQDAFSLTGSVSSTASVVPQPHPSTVGGTTTIGYTHTPASPGYGYQMGYPSYSPSGNTGQYFPSTHGGMEPTGIPNRSSPAIPSSSKFIIYSQMLYTMLLLYLKKK